jgi:integrating conjugative element protein (TIGR03759 family)
MTNFLCSVVTSVTSVRVLALILSAGFFPIATADQVNRSDIGISNMSPSAVNAEAMGFDGWGLNEEETERYELIMKGPRGNWTPDLSPLQVLGINAETVQERQYYARRLAVIEHDRLVRERAFEAAYLQAYAKLYPNDSLYMTTPPIARKKREKDSRKQLKVTLPCGTDSVCFKRIAPTLANATSVPVDLYFYGIESVDDIQTWAREIGIDPEWVRNKLITLNVGEVLSTQRHPDGE